jgi:hypothetical protein
MTRPEYGLRASLTSGLVLLAAGCTALLPGTDRAFDAAVVEVAVPTPLDGGTAARPVDAPGVNPSAMDAGTDRGAPAAPPPDVAPGDRGSPIDVPAPVDRGSPIDVPAPVDRGSPDAGRDPPGCGGAGRGGQPCCAGERCNDGYVCRPERRESPVVCARCGGNDEVCCAGDRCDGDRDCEDGRCE